MFCGEKVVGVVDVGRENLGKGLRWRSRKAEVLSMGVPILETMDLLGLQDIWILGSR